MTIVAAVADRLGAHVPRLANRVAGAAELTQLLRGRGLPTAPTSAFVLPLGLQGLPEDGLSGLFRQPVVETIGVFLLLQADGGEDRALDDLSDLVGEVLGALCGWRPGKETGVFRLLRGAIRPVEGGRLGYELAVQITDQLRVPA